MTNKQWIYVLKSDSFETIQLQYAPSGWNEQRVSIKRSPSYFGLTRSVSTSLRFFKDGKDFIQNVYERKGTEHEIYIGIYQYNPKPVDKFLLFFEGIIDLSTYTFNANDEGQFIEVDVNESSLARKLMSRDDIKVDLSRTTSIEGVELGSNQRITAQLHEREILLNGNYILDQNATNIIAYRSDIDTEVRGVSIPIVLEDSNIENLLTNPYGDVLTNSSLFYNKVDTDYKVNVKGKLTGYLHNGPSNISGTRKIVIREYTNDALTSWNESVLFTVTGNYADQVNFDLDIDATLYIEAGSYISFIIYSDQPDYYEAFFSEASINIEQIIFNDATNSSGYLVHECAERICEVIADKPNVLKSNVFGRNDIGYDSDGDYAYQLIIDGKGIRNIPNSSPSVSLKDFFDSLNSQRNLGLGIEYGGSGNDFVRIEDKAYFFSGEIIATIYNAKNLKKEVAREWIYNEVEVGYTKAEYEEVNGLEEYNNKFNWSDSIHTIKNKLNLVSKIRADGYGIEFARRKQYSDFPTEDTKYDNENFIIVLRKENDQYFSAKNENYTTVENIFSPETAYNLDITPGRMLRNNGDIIRAGLWHLLDQPLVFSYAEQKQNLRSQRIDGELIEENDDIDVNTLKQSRWIPEIYSYESVLTRELLSAITKNPRGIVKFSPETPAKTTDFYYGWILDIDALPENQSATFQLLRVNIANPDVSLIDPEGNTPDIIPPIIPEEEFGFGGWFDFIFTGEDDTNLRLLEDGPYRLKEDDEKRSLENA